MPMSFPGDAVFDCYIMSLFAARCCIGKNKVPKQATRGEQATAIEHLATTEEPNDVAEAAPDDLFTTDVHDGIDHIGRTEAAAEAEAGHTEPSSNRNQVLNTQVMLDSHMISSNRSGTESEGLSASSSNSSSGCGGPSSSSGSDSCEDNCDPGSSDKKVASAVISMTSGSKQGGYEGTQVGVGQIVSRTPWSSSGAGRAGQSPSRQLEQLLLEEAKVLGSI